MKLSDILYERVREQWEEARNKPFVIEMAKGILSEGRFRYYMLQDYLYLQDYIGLLTKTLALAGDPALAGFLKKIIDETEHEARRVHLPHMKKTGITDEDIASCKRSQVIIDYIQYMKNQLEQGGIVAGLTSLLQCSWIYAYIAECMLLNYPKEIASSPYRFWFDSYACPEYADANRKWIDVLDREAAEISQEKAEKLCRIFETCADFENRFWDALYRHDLNS